MAGVLGGYKHFFNDKFGFRTYITAESEHWLTNFLALVNGDMLYNFHNKNLGNGDNVKLGVFVGLGLGYRRIIDGNINKNYVLSGWKENRFELRINFGVRSVIAENHSIEIYGGIGTIPYTEHFKYIPSVWNNETIMKSWFPFTVGVRYIYNFNTNLDRIFKKK